MVARNKFSLLLILGAITALLILVFESHSTPVSFAYSQKILVDQFGYRPQDKKVAVIRVSQEEAAEEPVSIADRLFELRDVRSQRTFHAAKPMPWNDGMLHSQSGDYAWWFDFSDLQRPGSYVILDSKTGETSAQFEVSEDIYRDVLMAATRMFFYQRSGFPKLPPHADPKWQDTAAFLGSNQDSEAHYVEDKGNAKLKRDMRGGWFDAGDTNKYVTFATSSIHQLLDAYTQNPTIWTDNFNIPESGNGTPDLLDEIQFEIDWLKRMQDNDGGAFIKLGTLDYTSVTKPSLDRRPRYYGPKCSSSTIAIASMFAHAAFVYKDIPALKNEASELERRAKAAWNWFIVNPIRDDCDTQEIKSGDADASLDEQVGTAVSAAVYLFALTDQKTFGDYLHQHLQDTRPLKESDWSLYQSYVGESLLFYTRLKNAEPALQREIVSAFTNKVQQNSDIYGNGAERDPYQAYMPDGQYHWGSNAVKSNIGNANYDVMLHSPQLSNSGTYKNRALDIIHYLHGVNPMGIVFLSNMYQYGAEYSANEMFHEWFGHGIYKNARYSPNGPAPGYLTGGPNKDYSGTAPLKDSPPLKAYMDSSSSELRMWEITEPSIGYQGAYVKLLSKFVN